tara:strand:- start:359 stop:592 length:234 start_codon:yes stop_codon:yes gene_type:complete
MRACGDWVIVEKTEQKSASGIISSDGTFGRIVSVGEEAPNSIQKLEGKVVYYTASRTAQEINDYMAMHWADVFYVEE